MSGKRYDWDSIRNDYESGLSRRETKEKYDISQSAWSGAIRAGKIILKSSDEHFNAYNKRHIDDILVENSPHKDISSLKKRLLKEKLLTNVCYTCGLKPLWNNKFLVLHLDHKNGDNRDNRLNNLRMLCPNCHSQTNTYCGRNRI